MKKITYKWLEKQGFPEYTNTPDWDDRESVFELPNGIEVTITTLCNNQPYNDDHVRLEGFDDIKKTDID